jgi:hypothetical protein
MSGFMGVAARIGAGRILEARVLPRDVAWFYVRAVRLAISQRDRLSIATAPPPGELKALLTLARGCRHVVEIGTGDGWAAAALAIDDPMRHVTAYHRVAHPQRDSYLALAEASVRARVDARTGSSAAAVVPGSGSACMLVIAGTGGREDVMDTFSGCLAAVRVGGLVVFRGYGDPRHPGVSEAVPALGLDGMPGPGGTYVWRKPEAPKPVAAAAVAPPAPAPAAPRRRRRALGRLVVPALVVVGVGGPGDGRRWRRPIRHEGHRRDEAIGRQRGRRWKRRREQRWRRRRDPVAADTGCRAQACARAPGAGAPAPSPGGEG